MKIDKFEIKACIFDLDGTLLDSCKVWRDVDYNFFKKRNMEEPSDYAESIGHMGLDRAAMYTIERFGLDETKDDIINEWKSDVIKLYKEEVKLKPNAYEFLKYLTINNIPFCAATANSKDMYEGALIHNNIYEMFDFILDVSMYKNGKDAPEIYLDAASRLGYKPENICVFEDLNTPLQTAKKAGFITCAVFEETCKEETLKKETSNLYINDFKELM